MEAPPQLSRQALDEFKAIYHDEFDEQISNDEAQEMALRLLRLFDTLVQPSPADSPSPSFIHNSHS